AAARARRLRKRRAHEMRAEIRAADAEVDDRADGPSRGAAPQPAPDLRRDGPHAQLRRADVGNDVAAVDDERSLAHLAKRGVESRAAFRLVDLLSGKECRDPARE